MITIYNSIKLLNYSKFLILREIEEKNLSVYDFNFKSTM